MLKSLIAVLTIVICFNSDSFAAIRQSASKALSYRNIASSSGSISINRVKEQKKIDMPIQTVDIRSAFSKNISVLSNEGFMVLLMEKKESSWKISYDTDIFAMTSNMVVDGVRNIKFMPRNLSPKSTIFFDELDSAGKVVQNKAVYVKVH